MAKWYKYAVVRLASHPTRNEQLNVGLVVMTDDQLDVRPARNLDKLRAISAALDGSSVRASLQNLVDLDRAFSGESLSVDDRLACLVQVSPFNFSQLGRFEAHASSTYEHAISMLLSRLVEPEPAPMRKMVRRSKLVSSLKAALKEERVLARRGEDLSAHRVVTSWPLAEGLSADFLLQNGSMHVIETVDAQSEDVSLKKLVSDIAVSALILEQARITFGIGVTKARLVYSASSSIEVVAQPSLRAAEHQGAELVNWQSDDDKRRLLTEISKLAVPFEKQKRSNLVINSSTQGRLSLN